MPVCEKSGTHESKWQHITLVSIWDFSNFPLFPRTTTVLRDHQIGEYPRCRTLPGQCRTLYPYTEWKSRSMPFTHACILAELRAKPSTSSYMSPKFGSVANCSSTSGDCSSSTLIKVVTDGGAGISASSMLGVFAFMAKEKEDVMELTYTTHIHACQVASYDTVSKNCVHDTVSRVKTVSTTQFHA